MPEKTMKIGQKLQMLRQQKQLSVKQVAVALGVAQSTYRDWEYGRAIRGEPYSQLAEIFGVSLSELLNDPISGDRSALLQKLRQMEQLIQDIRAMI